MTHPSTGGHRALNHRKKNPHGATGISPTLPQAPALNAMA